MYKQETIFYPDTFQIHITKDYVNDKLVEEKHYTLENYPYYYKDYIGNYMFKRFFFHNEELSKKFTMYYYILTNVDNEHIAVKLYTEIDGITTDVKSVNKKYMITEKTCTQLCTLNNDDAIHYIQNYIKIQILEE